VKGKITEFEKRHIFEQGRNHQINHQTSLFRIIDFGEGRKGRKERKMERCNESNASSGVVSVKQCAQYEAV